MRGWPTAGVVGRADCEDRELRQERKEDSRWVDSPCHASVRPILVKYGFHTNTIFTYPPRIKLSTALPPGGCANRYWHSRKRVYISPTHQRGFRGIPLAGASG